MDAVAPALILSYGVGRLGCQFSGDGDWGIEAPAQPDWWFLPDWAWAYNYPHNVIDDGVRMADCTWNYCYELASTCIPYTALGGLLRLCHFWHFVGFAKATYHSRRTFLYLYDTQWDRTFLHRKDPGEYSL